MKTKENQLQEYFKEHFTKRLIKQEILQTRQRWQQGQKWTILLN